MIRTMRAACLALALLGCLGESFTELPPFDYIVVGAGTAGSVLAYRLAESGHNNVLVLEAGPSDADHNLQVHNPFDASANWDTWVDWSYTTVTNSGFLNADGSPRSVFWPRAKMWGGCSSLNAMLYIRGIPQDYDGWAALFEASSNSTGGWSYDECLPFFIKSEDNVADALFGSAFHGQGGPLGVQNNAWPYPIEEAMVAAAVEAGVPFNADFNGDTQTGANFYQLTQRNGRRWSTADAFLKPALAAKSSLVPPNRPLAKGGRLSGVSVESNAMVMRVLLTDQDLTGPQKRALPGGASTSGYRAYGVEYKRLSTGETIRRNASKEVVVCAGAINTPHLLMVSGVGDPNQLESVGIDTLVPLPGLGQNLMDHPAYKLTLSTPVLNSTQASVAHVGSLSDVGVFFTALPGQSNPQLPDIQISAAAALWDGSVATQNGLEYFTISPALNAPVSRGNLTLQSADITVPLAIYPNYYTDAEGWDMARMVASFKVTLAMATAPALAPWAPQIPVFGSQFPWGNCDTEEEMELFIRVKGGTSFHASGTAKMGPISDPMAVVDQDLQVYGVDSLRIVDASVMPVVTHGNTNAPTIMIAENIAARITRHPSHAKYS